MVHRAAHCPLVLNIDVPRWTRRRRTWDACLEDVLGGPWSQITHLSLTASLDQDLGRLLTKLSGKPTPNLEVLRIHNTKGDLWDRADHSLFDCCAPRLAEMDLKNCSLIRGLQLLGPSSTDALQNITKLRLHDSLPECLVGGRLQSLYFILVSLPHLESVDLEETFEVKRVYIDPFPPLALAWQPVLSNNAVPVHNLKSIVFRGITIQACIGLFRLLKLRSDVNIVIRDTLSPEDSLHIPELFGVVFPPLPQQSSFILPDDPSRELHVSIKDAYFQISLSLYSALLQSEDALVHGCNPISDPRAMADRSSHRGTASVMGRLSGRAESESVANILRSCVTHLSDVTRLDLEFDTFLKSYLWLSEFRVDRNNTRSWVYRLKELALTGPVEQFHDFAVALLGRAGTRSWDGLVLLPSLERFAFRMRYSDELRSKEISDELTLRRIFDDSLGYIRQRQEKALEGWPWARLEVILLDEVAYAVARSSPVYETWDFAQLPIQRLHGCWYE